MIWGVRLPRPGDCTMKYGSMGPRAAICCQQTKRIRHPPTEVNPELGLATAGTRRGPTPGESVRGPGSEDSSGMDTDQEEGIE